MSRRLRFLFVSATAAAFLAGCQTQRQAAPEPHNPTPVPGPATPGGPPAPPAPAAAAAPEKAAPGEKALVIQNGQETWMGAAEAEAAGYTLLDLSDDFTPYIFAEHRAPDGQVLHNRYRRVFLGLANDQLDEDGQPLPAGAKNYLELYGIFPSMSVLRARFLEDDGKTCLDEAELAALGAVDTVDYVAPDEIKRDEHKIARLKAELEAARRKFHAKTLAELVEKRPELARNLKLVEKRAAEAPAFMAVEKRLACEGFLKAPVAKGAKAHRTGIYDDVLRDAVKRFQQKHMIYESHYLRRETVDALQRPLLENDHRSLLRGLRERVVAAAAIIEDGSINSNALGPVPNLAEDYTKTAAEQLGWNTVEGAVAFFKRHAAADFKHLRAAVKLPARPSYYGQDMDLSVIVDRGEVWYDLPFDEKGVRKPQPRKKYPSFTLYLKANGKKVPLVRWRTTIGGWRAEQASDGYEYYRYKGSDVGPRVIRNVVAGPTWVAPESTPIRSLLKGKVVNGKWQAVVNYAELGPGYESAYGLVAGYFVIPGKDGRPDWDNQIRAHGSAEYLSMYSPDGYSHGCHRLPNHLAIRLYSFILHHRPMRIWGDQPLDMARQFLKGEDVFEIRLPSRGFRYELDPPLPVEVLEGEIKGDAQEPILGYVQKPGVRYPPGPPPPAPTRGGGEDRAGGGGEGNGAGPKASRGKATKEEDPEAKL